MSHRIVVHRIGLASATTLAEQAYGSTLFDGRWHSRSHARPRRLIYAASSRALAQLEKRVHANGIAPIAQALFRLELPVGLELPHAQDLGLGAAWRQDLSVSQAFGNAWLDGGETLAIRVPSIVEPMEDNVLLNAEHAEISQVVLVVERDPFEFDPRLGGG